MEISAACIKELREQCGAGFMDCRAALLKTEGDMDKALEVLKEQGFAKAAKKADRAADQGLVEAYIHCGGRIGAMVEVNCETDFVARTDEFKELAHNIAMQVAAMNPKYITEESIPADMPEAERAELDVNTACLLNQAYIKDPSLTIKDIIIANISKMGENIKVSRIARFDLSE
ncbi:MAG: translation elongation factor Ts [Dehalococcoidales bacterium]|nr:translation elongation factor Ts [Dehalococcoidales bacterium]